MQTRARLVARGVIKRCKPGHGRFARHESRRLDSHADAERMELSRSQPQPQQCRNGGRGERVSVHRAPLAGRRDLQQSLDVLVPSGSTRASAHVIGSHANRISKVRAATHRREQSGGPMCGCASGDTCGCARQRGCADVRAHVRASRRTDPHRENGGYTQIRVARPPPRSGRCDAIVLRGLKP